MMPKPVYAGLNLGSNPDDWSESKHYEPDRFSRNSGKKPKRAIQTVSRRDQILSRQ